MSKTNHKNGGIMKVLSFLLISLLVFTVPSTTNAFFGSKTHDECILDRMPGVQNNRAASEIRRACHNKYPKAAEPKRRLGIFGPKNYEECMLEHLTGDESDWAVNYIRSSCRRIFPRD